GSVSLDDGGYVPAALDTRHGGDFGLDYGGTRTVVHIEFVSDGAWVHADGGTFRLTEPTRLRSQKSSAAATQGEILAPMPGTVIALKAEPGARVEAGAAVAVVEAMKMEHVLV